jgi:hypothetical protein
MSRPKFFRDPLHLQLRFEPVDLDQRIPAPGAHGRQSWLLRQLIDTREFQRLRLIRQNGLANVVFHGAEHSRFCHSLGVMYLARAMYTCLVRNMGENRDEADELAVVTAAVLHDIGHGPFSHTIEEVLKEIKIDFHHETLTTRFMLEDGKINELLKLVDQSFPDTVAAFIDKKKRPADHWKYKIVSSQLDADRIDYLLRDAYFCGLKGHGFDHHRILDLLQHHDGTQIGIEAGALEAVEAYLVALDQLYRAIYYHHAVRAANRLLTSTLKRAASLSVQGDKEVLGPAGSAFRDLIEKGQAIELHQYARLGEHQVWTLIEGWRDHKDKTLAHLSARLMGRQLPKTMSLPMESYEDYKKFDELLDKAKDLAVKKVDYIDMDNVDFYVCADDPHRTSYKTYDWKPDSANDSIWIMEEGGKAEPLEDHGRSKIVQGLKETKYFPRLTMPKEVRELLRN